MTIPFLTDDIVKIIDELASESTAVYGTTAFWTIHPDYFYSKNFLKVLCQDKSFFVCDISEPTIVENLVAYAEQGANLYIYLRRAKDKLYKYNHLLHSKIMLFQHKYDNKFTLLIGSANITTRAIRGINKEAGVRIILSENDVLLNEVKDYLNEIKRCSVKIDPTKLDLYKFIQDQGKNNLYENCPLLYLTAKDHVYSNMAKGDIIQMLGVNDEIHEFYNKIESLNSRIALLVENAETKDTMVCVCGIKSIGEININNPETYQKDYDERLLFYLGLTELNGACTPAVVIPSMKISKQMFYISDFHAELIIEEIYSKVYMNEFSIKNKINPWREVKVVCSKEDFYLDKNSKTKKRDSSFKSAMNTQDEKIKIEEINIDFFKEEYFKKILNELTPLKLKLEIIYPPTSTKEYINSTIEINSWISQIGLNNEDRVKIKSQIEKNLLEVYNSAKSGNKSIHKKIRLLKPSLVFKNEKVLN